MNRTYSTIRLWVVVGILLALAALLVPMQRVEAQDVCRVEVTASPRLNIRTGPGTGYSVQRVINDGTLLTAVERRAVGNDIWLRIAFSDGREGWGASRYAGSTLISIPNTPACQALSPPPASQCFATVVATGNLNVRSSAGTSFTVVAQTSRGARLNVLADTYVSNNRWLHVILPTGTRGWVAATYFGATYVTLDSSPGCGAYRGAGVGWHTTIPNIAYGDLNASLDTIAARGYMPVVKAVEDLASARMADQKGGLGVWRTTRFGDCVATLAQAETQANLRYAAQRAYAPEPSEGLWIEPDNECTHYYSNMAWYDAYLAEQIRVWAVNGYQVVFATQPPGWWEQHQINALPRALAAARKYGACFGYHAYGVIPGARVSQSSIWIGFRHRQIRNWLDAAGYSDIPICATEVGTGTGRERFDPTDFRDYVNRAGSELLFIAWWTAGEWDIATTNGQMAYAASLLPSVN